jgi:LDH2 family malate/lactate/ureidoglycolate dehydrogenase
MSEKTIESREFEQFVYNILYSGDINAQEAKSIAKVMISADESLDSAHCEYNDN